MVNDVFKFPDGNGGFILKIQGADAKWHECDENGNYVEEEPKVEKSTRSAAKRKAVKFSRKTSLYMSDRLFKKLRHYCIENSTSMSAVINQVMADFLK